MILIIQFLTDTATLYRELEIAHPAGDTAHMEDGGQDSCTAAW
jgi:hypothetical protein